MITLEDLLKKYKFAPKGKQLFRKKRIWVDDLPDDMTNAGHKAYSKLVNFVYDLGKLTNEECAAHRMVDILDQITTEQY